MYSVICKHDSKYHIKWDFLLAWTWNISMFDTPNMQVLVIFFNETFRISCGDLVEQVRTLIIGIGAI